MAGLLVLAHENICQISSRGRVFRPQVKGLRECLLFCYSCFLLLFILSDNSKRLECSLCAIGIQPSVSNSKLNHCLS